MLVRHGWRKLSANHTSGFLSRFNSGVNGVADLRLGKFASASLFAVESDRNSGNLADDAPKSLGCLDRQLINTLIYESNLAFAIARF